MTRKRWEARTEITPELLAFREKRKWQINLRRYVIEKSPCPQYAPYFGLDIENIREWFACQFTAGISWENFGTGWQFEHVIPVIYFDHTLEDELKLCWNFINIRVATIHGGKNQAPLEILGAKTYFGDLYKETGFPMAKLLTEKLNRIEQSQEQHPEMQKQFLLKHKDYLENIREYSVFEFELLNHGRSIAEIEKELSFLQKNMRS